MFLRLALCNLTCTWCDTKYTWDWRHYDYKQEVTSMNVAEIEGRILEFQCPHLVITGGEPLMQQEELIPLVSSLKWKGFYCEVETNGTLAPLPEMANSIDQWNVSPKLLNSGNSAARREVPQVLEAFCSLPNAYFKFVIVEPGDVQEVCQLMDKYNLLRERIILMPEGQRPEIIQERGRWISEVCIREGFRFSTRLHILLWGDKRGK